MPALLFDLGGDRGGEVVRDRALHRLVAEAADTVQLGLVEPVEQHREVIVGLTREADDEGRADRQLRTDLAPAPDARERLLLRGRPFHAAKHVWARALE